ncbi:MAG TPA: hypothetical protein VF069_08805 [Streptosporangiaceae bacterium]
MNTVTRAALAAAERFMQLNARLVDRHRFAYHFRGGPAEPVLAALRPYANPDGGYGNALEPDLRGAASQPVPAQHALEIFLETGTTGDPAVSRLCDYLASITTADGGVPFVLRSAGDAPHGPWWEPPPGQPAGSLVPTATLAGQLHHMGVDHPWLPPAIDFCWTRIEKLSETSSYEAVAVLAFLDHMPERHRAEAAFDRLRGSFLANTALAPNATGEVHFPYDFAPHPGGFGRRVYDDATMDAHLDVLVAAQQEDGGWPVNWPIWTPVAGHDWRGWITVQRLLTLQAYGRLDPGAVPVDRSAGTADSRT